MADFELDESMRKDDEGGFVGPLAMLELLLVIAAILLSVAFVSERFFWISLITAAACVPAVWHILQRKVGIAAALLAIPVGLTIAMFTIAHR